MQWCGRLGWPLVTVIALAACAPRPDSARLNPGLTLAQRDYPPLIIGANTHWAEDANPLSCPRPGARVEQKGGPAFEYLGASPKNPHLCRMRIGGDEAEAWFAIWVTSWPGAESAYPALQRLMHGRTGDVEGFDVRMGPGVAFHDLMRNEGAEDISLLGTTYHALKISHYREGFDGNIYRSVSTVWKDIPTGMLIYGTYQHIAGRPELDDPLIPTAIIPLAAGK